MPPPSAVSIAARVGLRQCKESLKAYPKLQTQIAKRRRLRWWQCLVQRVLLLEPKTHAVAEPQELHLQVYIQLEAVVVGADRITSQPGTLYD